MDFNIGVADIINVRSVFFMLGVFLTVLLFRKALERLFPKMKDSHVWREDILPVLPIIWGGLVGYFALLFPYPEGFAASTYARVSYGLGLGWASGHAVRAIGWRLKRLNKPQEVPGPEDDGEEDE